MHLSTVQKRSAEFHHSAENPKPTRTQLNAGSIYLVSENDPPGVRGGRPPFSKILGSSQKASQGCPTIRPKPRLPRASLLPA